MHSNAPASQIKVFIYIYKLGLFSNSDITLTNKKGKTQSIELHIRCD